MKKWEDEYRAVYKDLLRKWNPELPADVVEIVSRHGFVFRERLTRCTTVRYSSNSFSKSYNYRIDHEELHDVCFSKMVEVFEYNFDEEPSNENFVRLAVSRVVKDYYDDLKNSGKRMLVTHCNLGKNKNNKDVLQLGWVNMAMCESITDGDNVFPGLLTLVKSENGNAVVKVYPRVFRIVCLNGSIRSCKNMNSFNFNVLESDVNELDSWLRCSIREAVLNKEVFKITADEMRTAAKERIKYPVEFLQEVSENKWHISRFASILHRYAFNNIYSVWGMANAITEEARYIKDIEEAVELAQQAGALIKNASKKPYIQWDQFYVCPGNGEVCNNNINIVEKTDNHLKKNYVKLVKMIE